MVKELLSSFNDYQQRIKPIIDSDLKEMSNIKTGLNISRDYIVYLRRLIRDKKFPSIEEEIEFFKHTKPFINGSIIFFSTLYNYQLRFQMGSVKKRRNLLDSELDEVRALIHRIPDFHGYYRTNDTRFDHFYFVRGHDQLDLISDPSYHYTDPDFSTSHDNSVAQIVAYDLLTFHFNRELESLRRFEMSAKTEPESPAILHDLSWTASKTDLVEVIYALHASGAIRDGRAEIKKMAMVCETLFKLDLGNVYKTYLEIKSRKSDKTTFLNRLKVSLDAKIFSEEEQY
jgi:hypothetical protein